MRDLLARVDNRQLELPVSPSDLLVVARVLGVLSLACVAFLSNDGVETTRIGLFLIAVASIQPGIPIFWRFQQSYQQALIVTDICSLVLIVAIAPQYYWLGALVAAGIVGNHAVLSSVRSFVLTAVMAIAALAFVGAFRQVDEYERGVAILAILAVGLGYLGHNTRTSMRASREDILHVLSAAGGLAHLTDMSKGIVDVVGDTEEVVGWPRTDWMSLDQREIIHPDDLADFWLDKNTPAGSVVDRTARIRTRDGRWMWIRDVSRVVMHDNRRHLRGFTIDVSKQQDGLHRVTTEALTDVLTGLRNRRSLLLELGARKLSMRHHLVLIDLNHFKDVNDTLGHDAGDTLLQVVAERMARCLRPKDQLARLGGDEFAIIMDDMSDMSAVVAAVDRVAFEVSRPVEIAGVNITTSISAGIIDARAGEADESTMLQRADVAMYAAKRLNRTSVVFDEELERTSVRRAQLSKDLAGALASHDLTLHFQPIVDTTSGEIVEGEGLARWDHPDFGLMLPDSFLDVVLMSDLSGAFTRSMVLDAIATAATLAGGGSGVTIAVNMPIRTLEDVEFGRWFAAACEASDVSPSQLVFEITEQEIHNTESITTAIDRLAAVGVTLSMDDFGAGHATFERLRWRNVAQLKLDRDLLVDVTTDERGQEVLRSLVDLAARLDYQVVAEGVETDEQFALVRQLGFPLAQGYFFARPMKRSDFIDCVLHGGVPRVVNPVSAG